MSKIAFLFPGQGSQSVGMGRDLYDAHASVRDRFEKAEAITGLPIGRLCFEGPMPELTETVNLQPAITVVNLAVLSQLTDAGIKPDVCAGHSLGEYGALCAAGAISEEDAIRLVYKRGELMHREATLSKGAMTAIIGLPIDTVQDLVDSISDGVVSVANHNAEKQIVITGAPGAVKAAATLAAEKKGKAIPLKVSGAWHSELMRGAEPDFSAFMADISFAPPVIPVIHNVTAESIIDASAIKDLMVRQICSPVRWYDSMMKMMAEQVDTFVEVGPGKVLAGLVKKSLPKDYSAKIFNVFDTESVAAFVKELTRGG